MNQYSYIIERRDTNRGGFTHWLEQARERQADGWDVTVLVSQKGDHAILIAYRDGRA